VREIILATTSDLSFHDIAQLQRNGYDVIMEEDKIVAIN